MSTERISANQKAKMETAAAVKETFSKATSVVFLGFKGIDVITVTELRARFRKEGVVYKVIKNKLLKQALKGSALESHPEFAKKLVGETAVAFSFEDPSVAAKVVKAFRKEGPKAEQLEVKCGVLDNAYLTAQQVESSLASLPSKDELRAMLLATMQAPAQSLVRQLAAGPQNLAYVLDARKRQLEESA